MPINKLASFRYRVINNCLKNNVRTWTRIEIIEEIDKQLFESFGINKGISKRTFHYDIELMRSLPPRGFDAPIKVMDGKYSYSERDFSIDNIPLSEFDIESINNAVELLSHFKQIPIHSQLSLVKDKLTGQVQIGQSTEPIIELEYKEVKGKEWLTPLYNLIKLKKVIELGYHSFTSAETRIHVLHPYFLKQYNHRWYLLALNEKYKNVGTYSLDRIESVNPKYDLNFNDSLNLNHATLFKDIIGVTLESSKIPVEIIATIIPSQSPYVKTKPIHDSQTVIEENENGLKISLHLIPNYEFYSTILSMGDGIKILSPDNIKNSIIEKLKSAFEQYF